MKPQKSSTTARKLPTKVISKSKNKKINNDPGLITKINSEIKIIAKLVNGVKTILYKINGNDFDGEIKIKKSPTALVGKLKFVSNDGDLALFIKPENVVGDPILFGVGGAFKNKHIEVDIPSGALPGSSYKYSVVIFQKNLMGNGDVFSADPPIRILK